jgi:transmembrane sensor
VIESCSTAAGAFRLILAGYLRPLVLIESLLSRGAVVLHPDVSAGALKMMVAAVLAAVALAAGSVGGLHDGPEIYRTTLGEIRTIKLEDGSLVQLAPHTELRVQYVERARTAVLLGGEAYFDVILDPMRPFDVGVGGKVVRALGTAFNVSHRAGHAAEVLVSEGRLAVGDWVQVAIRSFPEKSIQLEAGQSLLLDAVANQDARDVSKDEMRRRLAWREGLIVSQGDPLTRVVDQMNLYSDRKLVIDNPTIANVRIGGSFVAKETRGILDAFAAIGIHARVVRRNGVEEIHLY